MDLMLKAIMQDLPILIPIFICSILVVWFSIDRLIYYAQNKRDIVLFVQDLQKALVRNNIGAAKRMSTQLGGIFSDMTDEAIRIYTEQKAGFSRSFDIAANLASRKLEEDLTILGTVGGVAPFLGLFGTVVRILYTFQDLAVQGNQSAAVAMGIGSALIATAFGLGVAIIAVILFNIFQSTVKRFEDDFQLIKLLFLSFVDSEEDTTIQSKSSVAL